MNVHSVSSVTLETQLIHRPSKARSHWCALWWNRNVWFIRMIPQAHRCECLVPRVWHC